MNRASDAGQPGGQPGAHPPRASSSAGGRHAGPGPLEQGQQLGPPGTSCWQPPPASQRQSSTGGSADSQQPPAQGSSSSSPGAQVLGQQSRQPSGSWQPAAPGPAQRQSSSGAALDPDLFTAQGSAHQLQPHGATLQALASQVGSSRAQQEHPHRREGFLAAALDAAPLRPQQQQAHPGLYIAQAGQPGTAQQEAAPQPPESPSANPFAPGSPLSTSSHASTQHAGTSAAADAMRSWDQAGRAGGSAAELRHQATGQGRSAPGPQAWQGLERAGSQAGGAQGVGSLGLERCALGLAFPGSWWRCSAPCSTATSATPPACMCCLARLQAPGLSPGPGLLMWRLGRRQVSSTEEAHIELMALQREMSLVRQRSSAERAAAEAAHLQQLADLSARQPCRAAAAGRRRRAERRRQPGAGSAAAAGVPPSRRAAGLALQSGMGLAASCSCWRASGAVVWCGLR